MENINIGKAHWAATMLLMLAIMLLAERKNNIELLGSFVLFVFSSMMWMVLNARLRDVKPKTESSKLKKLHITFVIISGILFAASYIMVFIEPQRFNAVLVAMLATITVMLSSGIRYYEVNRSSN